MIRLCNQCKCELNGENTAKKDARRFRKVCRPCFRENRSRYRAVKSERQGEVLDTLILNQVIKLDPVIAEDFYKKQLSITDKLYTGFLDRIINMIKNVIKER